MRLVPAKIIRAVGVEFPAVGKAEGLAETDLVGVGWLVGAAVGFTEGWGVTLGIEVALGTGVAEGVAV